MEYSALESNYNMFIPRIGLISSDINQQNNNNLMIKPTSDGLKNSKWPPPATSPRLVDEIRAMKIINLYGSTMGEHHRPT